MAAIRKAKGWQRATDVYVSLAENNPLKPMLSALMRFAGLGPADGNYPIWLRKSDEMWIIRLYTARYVYIIHARNTTVNGHPRSSYLGCGMKTREPRPGETHLRGCDMVDGEWTPATWTKILQDIVAYEIVPVPCPEENPPKPANQGGPEVLIVGDAPPQ